MARPRGPRGRLAWGSRRLGRQEAAAAGQRATGSSGTPVTFDWSSMRGSRVSQEMTPGDGKQYVHDARTPAEVMRPLDLERA